MRLSVAIMAHPTRRDGALRVQEALGGEIPIIYDTNPVLSADPEQRWATGRRAWEAYDPAADWHLVLQDDAIVCQDMLASLELALDQLGPIGLMSAFTGAGRPEHYRVHRGWRVALEKGHSWFSLNSLYWGVAIVAPTHTIPDMLAWCDQKTGKPYDMRIGIYYRDIVGWRTWYPVPSLVDHDEVPSLIGHGAGRVALEVCRGSALDIDWTRVPPGGLNPWIPGKET